MPRLSPISGKYMYVDFGGVEHRVYFEEAGQGVPVLLQHTAGSDSRQWRHLLEDPEITSGRCRRRMSSGGSRSTSCTRTTSCP